MIPLSGVGGVLVPGWVTLIDTRQVFAFAIAACAPATTRTSVDGAVAVVPDPQPQTMTAAALDTNLAQALI